MSFRVTIGTNLGKPNAKVLKTKVFDTPRQAWVYAEQQFGEYDDVAFLQANVAPEDDRDGMNRGALELTNIRTKMSGDKQ